MEELNEKILTWAEERGINNPETQLIKSFEEFGELCDATTELKQQPFSWNDRDQYLGKVKDAIGDTYVTVIIEEYLISGDCVIEEPTDKGEVLLCFEYHEIEIARNLGMIAKRMSHGKKMLGSEADHIVQELHSIARLAGTNLKACVELAYDEIKDRKGRTVNGNFIKEQQ